MTAPLANLARRLPPTPSVRTTLCTLAITAIGASVARVCLLTSGAQLVAADFVAVPAAFLVGVGILHMGHCVTEP